MLGLIKAAFSDFVEDECPRMAASMSYFTIFSLAPVLLLVLMVVVRKADAAEPRARQSRGGSRPG